MAYTISTLSYSKTCLKGPLKIPNISFLYRLLLNTGQKFCRMLQGEHSAMLSTFFKLSLVIKTFILSIVKWLFKTGLLYINYIEYCMIF